MPPFGTVPAIEEHYIDVQLTNDQVLNLKAGPVTVIPAPGPGKGIVEIRELAVLDSTNGVYTDVAGDGYFGPQFFYSPSMTAVSATHGVDVAMPLPAVAGITRGMGYPSVGQAGWLPKDNEAVVLTQTNGAEWGGGDPANTLSLRVYYRIVDMPPTAPF